MSQSIPGVVTPSPGNPRATQGATEFSETDQIPATRENVLVKFPAPGQIPGCRANFPIFITFQP